MLKSKSFVKKTRKGGVIKIVREHYLRDDIWCGSEACSQCKQDSFVLEKAPSVASDKCNFPHYILPDTNVVLHQVDILEDEIIKNCILLQTVQQEVKHRSLPAYKRIQGLTTNSDKKFYVFSNEYHKETFIERLGGETANDYNDRVIRKAATWYSQHLEKNGENVPKIVLLTNDRANREKAKNEGIIAYTVHEYVQSLTDKPYLVDRLAQLAKDENDKEKVDQDIKTGKGRNVLYPEHLNLAAIQKGIKEGKYKQGTFLSSRENFREGYVSIPGEEKMYFIKGLANQNRVVSNDTVAIEVLPKSKWTCPSSLVEVDENVDPEAENSLENDEETTSSVVNSSAQPTCRVVGVIKRNWRQYCGTLEPPSMKGGSRHLFKPAEKRIPKIRIETRQAESLLGHRIIVTIDSWPRNSRYPVGHFVKNLGKIGDKDTENEVLLLEHDVPHATFSETVLSFLPKMPWVITEEDLKVRTDLRWLDICSVDPPGCTDIDDALHCRSLDNGNLEVGVHIADVSHFIQPGNALDEEASNRGTTVYLTDKRIDMVPDLLSSNLCSLRGGEERFAFSVLWEMTKNAEIIETKFMKSVIRSRAALTYEEAQLRIDDKSQSDAVTTSLRNLLALAKILKKGRLDKGALVLASPEIRFNIDSETHDPIDVQEKMIRETNSMVEEFMLLANTSVAKKILKDFTKSALLRRHPVPPPSQYEMAIKAALSRGFKLEIDNGLALSQSLDKAVMEDNPLFNTLLRMLTTRCMTQAVYFSSGTVPEEDFFHFGLASPIYTHFTSPIRRYADLMVHRMLAVAIGYSEVYPELLNSEKMQDICKNLNYRHKMAQYAGRSSVELHTHIFFRDKVTIEDGYILFIRKNALQVFIPKYGFEGTLYLKEKGKDSIFTYNEQEPSQSAGHIKFRLFDKVLVQISTETTNLQHQRLRLQLVQPEVPGFSVPRTPASSSRKEDEEPPAKKLKQK
ncbi:Exosome complex exonuclease RRP44 [Holothuria leucospilota]|uniref:Protein DIS3 homolog n=1 Tax=Holothuria leucospilota TaxID=206669 RepID=A0A9Q1GZT9_HOLLE|nr:Exosome complex exonuclease RRP44 [Holothuria leucospilota]